MNDIYIIGIELIGFFVIVLVCSILFDYSLKKRQEYEVV